jgi:hypothetical protein
MKIKKDSKPSVAEKAISNWKAIQRAKEDPKPGMTEAAMSNWIAIQMIADAELKVAACRVLASAPGTSAKLFGRRAARVFTETLEELDKFSVKKVGK